MPALKISKTITSKATLFLEKTRLPFFFLLGDSPSSSSGIRNRNYYGLSGFKAFLKKSYFFLNTSRITASKSGSSRTLNSGTGFTVPRTVKVLVVLLSGSEADSLKAETVTG